MPPIQASGPPPPVLRPPSLCPATLLQPPRMKEQSAFPVSHCWPPTRPQGLHPGWEPRVAAPAHTSPCFIPPRSTREGTLGPGRRHRGESKGRGVHTSLQWPLPSLGLPQLPGAPLEGHSPFSLLYLQSFVTDKARSICQNLTMTVTFTDHLLGARDTWEQSYMPPEGCARALPVALRTGRGGKGGGSLGVCGERQQEGQPGWERAGVRAQLAPHSWVSNPGRRWGWQHGCEDKQGQGGLPGASRGTGMAKGGREAARRPVEDSGHTLSSVGAMAGGDFEPEGQDWNSCLPNSLWPQH